MHTVIMNTLTAHRPLWGALALMLTLTWGCAGGTQSSRSAASDTTEASEVSEASEPTLWVVAEPPPAPSDTRGLGHPIFEQSHRAVAIISTSSDGFDDGSAGVLVHDDGWVLTTAESLSRVAPGPDLHVVVWVRFKEGDHIGEAIPAFLHKRNDALDLAVLKLQAGPDHVVGYPIDLSADAEKCRDPSSSNREAIRAQCRRGSGGGGGRGGGMQHGCLR